MNPAYPRKNDEVTTEPLGGEWMLHDSANKKVHALNHTAYFVWERCDGHTPIDGLLMALHEHYPDIPEAQLERDLQALLSQLTEKRLLVSKED